MSKILDLLNKAKEQRPGKYSSAITKIEPKGLSPKWIAGLALAALLLFNIGLSLKLLIGMKRYNADQRSMVSKIENLEQAIGENSHKLRLISTDIKTDLEKLAIGFIRIEEQISQFGEKTEANTFAIEVLTKAKNTLFSKIGEIEAELDSFKKALSPTKTESVPD